MTPKDKDISRRVTEDRLLESELDFSAAYLAVKNLNSHIQFSPDYVTQKTGQALVHVIESNQFESQRQVLFLYREAAQALVNMVCSTTASKGADIIEQLQSLLLKSTGRRRQAISETLSSLPVSFRKLEVSVPIPTSGSDISFYRITEALNLSDPLELRWKGRSLTGKTTDHRTGVIKFLTPDSDPYELYLEAWWMDTIQQAGCFKGEPCDIPVPVIINDASLFKIKEIPEHFLEGKNIHPDLIVIAFSADGTYFHYPNEPDPETKISLPVLDEVLSRNARLLGRLSSMGIIHTALIPLFHNRVQQDRRADGGRYEWERGGRLDRWLDSCRHPNIAASGLRDFEHLTQIQQSKRLQNHIGSHLLSLILVAGSYFRSLDPDIKGLGQDGKPVDTRYLFDTHAFQSIIQNAADQYYLGFTGTLPWMDYSHLPVSLTQRLVQEMGVDTYMEEIVRIEDQNRMDDLSFKEFLMERGIPKEKLSSHQKGRQDLTILSGPHLGGFNQRISVPELIEFLFTFTALCISGRYILENNLKHLSR